MNYTQHKNQSHSRTPTKSSSSRRRRVVAESPEINQLRFNRGIRSEDNSTTYDEISYEEDHGQPPRRRVNLYRDEGDIARGSIDDFDRLSSPLAAAAAYCDPNNKTGDIDQWPSPIDDTDHPVVFVENRVYVAARRQSPEQKRKKKVLFEKVNYEKYKRATSERSCGPGEEDEEEEEDGGHQGEAWEHRKGENYFVSPEKEQMGHQWCQDLLNWSREAAEFQRKRQTQLGDENEGGGDFARSVDSSNWFQGKFSVSSSSRYNKMSSTDDSGVVCQFEEDEDFWTRSGSANDINRERRRQKQMQEFESPPESWEALKRQVFEPPEEDPRTRSQMVRDSEGRLLGRRCSCNSMCTSLCTMETWLDDEAFDNSFNEELERRCGITTN